MAREAANQLREPLQSDAWLLDERGEDVISWRLREGTAGVSYGEIIPRDDREIRQMLNVAGSLFEKKPIPFTITIDKTPENKFSRVTFLPNASEDEEARLSSLAVTVVEPVAQTHRERKPTIQLNFVLDHNNVQIDWEEYDSPQVAIGRQNLGLMKQKITTDALKHLLKTIDTAIPAHAGLHRRKGKLQSTLHETLKEFYK